MYGRPNQKRKSVRRRLVFLGYRSKKFELEVPRGETCEQLAKRLKQEHNIKITPRYAR